MLHFIRHKLSDSFSLVIAMQLISKISQGWYDWTQ